MELLGRRSRLFALAGLALGGCAVVDWIGRPRPLAFDHRLHVAEEGLACVGCHEGFAVSEEPGMPLLDGCLFCHEVIDEEKAPERRIEALFADGAFRARRVSALSDEVLFGHRRHVEALDDCGACHRGIEENERVGDALRVTMADCVACHEERGEPATCETCHTQVGRDWAPESHAHAWRKNHGAACRRAGRRPVDDCSLCHEESTCVECHMVEAPQNHNAHWRLRGHGVSARIDRESCAACHEPATCDRCHAQTLPRNHRGAWGSPLSRHCTTCHLPIGREACVTCHMDAPSHALAPPKPSWHLDSFNCRQCHVPGVRLTHMDNGSDCNICHF